MSSYWTGYSGTVLILSAPEFQQFIHDYAKMHSLPQKFLDIFCEETGSLNEYSFIKTKGLLENNPTDTFYITEITTDCCEGMYFRPFKHQGLPNTQQERGDKKVLDYRWSDTDCYVIFANKDMTSYNAFVEKPYASYEDFVQEFRDKMDCYLPFDFDWDAHLGYFAYACFA